MVEDDTWTVDELRERIRTADAPDRVRAAFELGNRLGAEVTAELSLAEEASSGVRRHWLTILASYGEREAVRAIAEHHVADAEGEHALRLAVQLGITDPDWLADRFNETTEYARRFLLAGDDDLVAWSKTSSTLEQLLWSDFPEIRRDASRRLLLLRPRPGLVLQDYARRRPAEATEVLGAWARGPDHRALLDRLPLWVEREDAGLRALAAAGRTYPLREMRSVILGYPHAFSLVTTPCERGALLRATDEALEGSLWPSPSWFAELRRTLTPPWTPKERAVFDRWAEDAADSSPDDWDDPIQTEVLGALGLVEPTARTVDEA